VTLYQAREYCGVLQVSVEIAKLAGLGGIDYSEVVGHPLEQDSLSNRVDI